MANGTEYPLQQERATLFIVNKLLPSLQAVAIAIHEADPLSRHDIDSLLLTSGLSPQLIDGFTEDNQPVTAELIDSSDDSIEGHPPPESDA
jgi:hypothetical protein